MNEANLAVKGYHLFDALTWIAKINIAIVAFSLVGGIVAGAAPSAVAASALVRRRTASETFSVFPAFWKEYRSRFTSANLLLVPLAAVAGALAFSWQFFDSLPGVFASAASVAALGGAGLVVAILTVVVPLVNHYDVGAWPAVRASLRLLLANPLLLLANLLSIGAVSVATAMVPGLLPFFSLGVLTYLTTRMSLEVFRRNEQRLDTAAAPSPLPA